MSVSLASEMLCQPLTDYTPAYTAALVLVLALPHILYAVVWFKPQAWQALFPDNALETFAMAGALGKVLQFTCLTFWMWTTRPTGLCFDLSPVEPWRWLAFLGLLTFGQALNVGIYKAIGKAGVYYGFKLGKKVPWVTGFPFNIMSHPQYVGSTLTIWGALLLVYAVQPPHLQPMCGILCAYWSSLYLISGVKEHFF